MAVATLSRGNTTLTLPLIEEANQLVVSRDIGKPNQQIQLTGGLNPRAIDQRSGTVEYTLLGRYPDTQQFDPENEDTRKTCYVRAIQLADFIKSGSDGEPITLDIDMPEYDTAQVVPQAEQEQALTLEYIPGAPGQVLVNLGLSTVDRVNGGVPQQATTPTAQGNGPIQLRGPSRSVDLVQDVEVVRSVGRPNSKLETDFNRLPYLRDRFKSTYDAFELAFQSSDPSGTIRDIADMFSQQLASENLILDFQGVYGMGAFNVVPEGSQALRHARTTGIEGHGTIPTINLRRVR